MDNLKKTIQRKLEPLSIISNALNNDLSVPELKKENKVENYLNLKHNEYDYQNKLLYLLNRKIHLKNLKILFSK